MPVPQNAHQPAYGTAPLPHRNHRLLYRKKKKDPYRIERERSLRSPQPQRPNVVSEWARKRK